MGNRNSGRRPRGMEARRYETIERAWDMAHQVLCEPKSAPLDLHVDEQQFDIVKTVVGKTIPEEHVHSGNVNVVHTINYSETQK